jgi:acetylornithine deacetylase/succinyl-diaminopimelate desuccinylase-like protein
MGVVDQAIMNTDEQTLMQRLQAHVQTLAGDIGERNIWRPAALNDAAQYIGDQWNRQGYEVKRLTYQISGVSYPNLEVTRDGDVRRREILLVGAHYDSVIGSPGGGVTQALDVFGAEEQMRTDPQSSPFWRVAPFYGFAP